MPNYGGIKVFETIKYLLLFQYFIFTSPYLRTCYRVAGLLQGLEKCATSHVIDIAWLHTFQKSLLIPTTGLHFNKVTKNQPSYLEKYATMQFR